MRTAGKIVKFIFLAYVFVFALILGMIVLTNIMLAGLS